MTTLDEKYLAAQQELEKAQDELMAARNRVFEAEQAMKQIRRQWYDKWMRPTEAD